MSAGDLPDELWIGKIDGQWPVQAFTESIHAKNWYLSDPSHRRVFLVPLGHPVEYEVVQPPAEFRVKGTT